MVELCCTVLEEMVWQLRADDPSGTYRAELLNSVRVQALDKLSQIPASGIGVGSLSQFEEYADPLLRGHLSAGKGIGSIGFRGKLSKTSSIETCRRRESERPPSEPRPQGSGQAGLSWGATVENADYILHKN